MWCLTETPAHNKVTPLPRGILVAGQLVRVNSLLLDRLKHPSLVGADPFFLPSAQAATLPVWAPISSTKALALELFGRTTLWSAATWTNEIQDRRNVILGE
jgi:hypothetical protein